MPINGNNILITGGAGFIGSKLIEVLADRNNITVYDNYHRDTLSATGLVDHPNVTIINGNVLDSDLLNQSRAWTSLFTQQQ